MTPEKQFIQEATVLAESITSWLGPEVPMDLGRRIRAAAPFLVSQAVSDDDNLRAEAAQSILWAVHGAGEPDPEWWSTPLGVDCAISLGSDMDAVTRSVAAAMLGVHPGTVAQMLARGSGALERHPDGGIVRASVAREIERRRRRGA